MPFLQNPFSGAFGLHLCDSVIKLVRLQKKWHPKNGDYFDVVDIRKTSLPTGCIANGEIQQKELVSQKIKLLISKEGGKKPIKSPWVVVNLPVSKTFLKLIRIKSQPELITTEAVYFEAAKHLPFDTKDVAIDWQIITDNEKPNGFTKVLIGAAPKNIADSYLSVIEDAGLYPLALEIEDLSIARSMITAKKTYQNEARAILDIGSSRSSIIIYDKGSIQFSSLINVCGDLIDTTLTQRLKIDRETATKLKDKNGLTYDLNHPLYLKVVNDAIDNLIEEIKNILIFYKNHFNNPNPVTHITMSGGLSAMKNLDKLLSKKLRVETAPGNAWKNLFNKKFNEDDRVKGLPFAAAIGLALRATEAGWFKKG
ncbi:MAG: hypothetical protein COU29_02305 [Candidatus Magasanikbacteria bacterium CG10_big_fil_rev_8_21_14_0_10_36_32]|uniref:SHS2 domain-containing protein n=1 Tax=Candidatus Magasanikbacteria bacterium CG10_big_fil_rev_8_21_14_0_10_36_32 TaxID=1974646 RepID=A0A2M6W759_9BACT|nr:MAG: hypothetical protein COU29_02305 [Candidatus Magasanikbacteria bacterium CG10_big_fil_rev_8_21_14_0_10_36_32]